MDLADRMKNYEFVSRNKLLSRTPVIIRVDGRAFHTFTKDFDRPFDEMFSSAMQMTMVDMCCNLQNCVLGYTQSDEISLLMVDYKDIKTEPLFRTILIK
jgi:tRNA(His) 5'-end guanylyltransferase